MSLGSKIIGFLRRGIAREGLSWFIVTLLQRIVVLMRSAPARLALGAPGLVLGGPARILGSRNIRFGRDVFINGPVWIEAVCEYGEQTFQPRITLGDRVSLSSGVHISAILDVSVGDDVLMGSHVYISDHGHGIYRSRDATPPHVAPTRRPLGGGGVVVIERNVWIGDNVIILGPVRIGQGAVIAANAVVRQDVAPFSIVAGVPARAIKLYSTSSAAWESVK